MSLRAAAFMGATCVTVLGAGCSSGSSSDPASGPRASGGSVAGVGGSGNGQGGQIGQSGGAPNPSSGGASGASGASPGSGDAGIRGASGGAPSGGVAGTSSSSGGAADGGACCATKACQPDTVQACVCTDWHQGQCCTGAWDAICQTTAEQKCAAPHCSTDPAIDPSKGACCATHASGGCSDKATETCVCGLLPDCCSKAWDAVCVQLVREEHCETGVRDCVCTTWQQSTCCDTSWTDVCRIVAEDKCGAKLGCP